MTKKSQIAPAAVLLASPLFGKLVGSLPGEIAGRVSRKYDGSDTQSAIAGAAAGGLAGGLVTSPYISKAIKGGKVMNGLGLGLASKNKRWALAAMLAPTIMSTTFGGLRGVETESKGSRIWRRVEEKLYRN